MQLRLSGSLSFHNITLWLFIYLPNGVVGGCYFQVCGLDDSKTAQLAKYQEIYNTSKITSKPIYMLYSAVHMK